MTWRNNSWPWSNLDYVQAPCFQESGSLSRSPTKSFKRKTETDNAHLRHQHFFSNLPLVVIHDTWQDWRIQVFRFCTHGITRSSNMHCDEISRTSWTIVYIRLSLPCQEVPLLHCGVILRCFLIARPANIAFIGVETLYEAEGSYWMRYTYMAVTRPHLEARISYLPVKSLPR